MPLREVRGRLRRQVEAAWMTSRGLRTLCRPRVSSPFLEIPESDWVAANGLAFAVRDRYPVSNGHTLVIPRRLVATWFEATRDEKLALLDLVDTVKRALDLELRPDGYNVGFNSGLAAGQTVAHLHVHVIPRFSGDMPDPRGGVRHVIPWKGNYLAPLSPPLVIGGNDPFLLHLKPLFAQAREIAIVAAFVQESGLAVLEAVLLAALERGTRVRVLTGDYLAITQVEALETLLDWSSGERWRDPERGEPGGVLEARVIEVDRLSGATRSFHPKSWRFEGPGFGVAFVGSSNVSRTALGAGIEWNLRTSRERDPGAYARIAEAFEELWTGALALTADWIQGYAIRARRTPIDLPASEVDSTPSEPVPPATPVQTAALEALSESRERGHGRALVVHATGLGKTMVAVLDVERYGLDRGRLPRVLFLAHRAELLDQAARTFRPMLRRSFPEAQVSWFAAERNDLQGDVVMASVQKLARPENLERLAAVPFEYVIVDEVHHADARTYRTLLDRLAPRFLLGLTATPERADEGDVLGLFDDHVAHRVDLGEGIQRELLVPFNYFGLKDEVDYRPANIPWRNRRFDPVALATAVQTHKRMERLWEDGWRAHPARKTIVFCCSIEHARFVRDWLRGNGIRIEAVHSGEDSADRGDALVALKKGELDAICTVDLFNEGLDAPWIDRVVMLRPTESRVVFLQQLGRGLRRDPASGKTHLTVIDFVGNHRIFLDRLRLLLSFAERPTGLREFLDEAEPELPPGCSLHVAIEAKQDLVRLLGSGGRNEAERVYRELRAMRDEDDRPTIVDLYFQGGQHPGSLRETHGGWFRFVSAEGDLRDSELRVLEAAGEWLDELETTRMEKSFKMVVLEALLEVDALTTGLPLPELAQRCHAILVRSPALFADIEAVKAIENPRTPDPAAWLSYWKKFPISAWTERGQFRVEGDRFVPRFSVAPEDQPALASMTRELVDYRLARYRARKDATGAAGTAFECRVISNQRDPILKLPDRKHRPDLPLDEVDVRLPDNRIWRFRFAQIAVNVARPVGAERNQLPDLLRQWFGPTAGQRGTAFSVRFTPSPDGWWIEPAQGRAEEAPQPRGLLRAFPTLQAAAGSATVGIVDAPEAEMVALPVSVTGEGLFAIRADGDSMDGGPDPIKDGDWLVFRYARGAPISGVANRVALIQTEDAGGSFGLQVKRVVKESDGWQLRSDNPARPSFAASERTTVIATLVAKVHPEDLAPTEGAQLAEEELAEAFGLSAMPVTGRVAGHLFVLAQDGEVFPAPDELAWIGADRRPGETLFVLVRPPGHEKWRYVGVGRWQGDEGVWRVRELDYATWRALGKREASRPLPEQFQREAERFVDEILQRVGQGGWVGRDEKRCRLVGKAPRGGLRIDGGEGGFEERTVSLLDLGWVLAAEEAGGLLDEARVNRMRYLEGTPKGSTRWIDTGWAIVLVAGNHD